MGLILCIFGWVIMGINLIALSEPDPVITGMSIGIFLSAIIVSTFELIKYD